VTKNVTVQSAELGVIDGQRLHSAPRGHVGCGDVTAASAFLLPQWVFVYPSALRAAGYSAQTQEECRWQNA
jgi:hypothetical protein